MARKSKTSKKLSKKLDKLEKQADALRGKAEKKGKELGKELSSKAEKRGKELHSKASERFDVVPAPEKEKGKKGSLFFLLLAAIGGALFTLKKKRDQELDEALWEEPRSI